MGMKPGPNKCSPDDDGHAKRTHVPLLNSVEQYQQDSVTSSLARARMEQHFPAHHSFGAQEGSALSIAGFGHGAHGTSA